MSSAGRGGSRGTAFVVTHEANPRRRDKSMSLIALAVTRSLGRRGIPVVRVHPNRLEYGLASRYCTSQVVSPDMYDSPEELVAFLLHIAKDYAPPRVLIPASDDSAEFLGLRRELLRPRYAVCASSPAVTRLVMSKQRQYDKARELGIPTPETYFPQSDDEADELIRRLDNFPYIIKPIVAHRWRLASMQGISKGRKAVRVANRSELRDAYAGLGEERTRVMIQEVIGGRDEQLFTFLGCIAEDGTPLGYCVRRKIRQHPLDFGYCTMTVSCHDDTVVEQSLRLLRGIGFTGIGGIEYKLDAATGEYKLIEINARPVNTIGLAPACGVDLPYLAYCSLAGLPVTPVTTWRDDVRWTRLWFDLLAVHALKARGGPSYAAWARSLLRGHSVEAALALDDPRPGLSYYRDLVWNELGRQMRKRLPVAVQPRTAT